MRWSLIAEVVVDAIVDVLIIACTAEVVVVAFDHNLQKL